MPIRLKWPNDLYVADAKLAGILVEARWRANRLDWVAIGIGVNVRAPTDVENAASLKPRVDRVDVLTALVPALRAAAQARGPLSSAELEEFAARDMAAGRACVTPASGRVCGITSSGELLVDTDVGLRTFRDGSLTFAGAAPWAGCTRLSPSDVESGDPKGSPLFFGQSASASCCARPPRVPATNAPCTTSCCAAVTRPRKRDRASAADTLARA